MRGLKNMHARLAKVISSTGSRLSRAVTQAGTTFTRMKKSDVAEAMIATWCIEYLRIRKVGGFNVVEIVVISALMLGVKTIVIEAGRRRYSDKGKRFVMPDENTQVEPVGNHRGSANAHRQPRRNYRYVRIED